MKITCELTGKEMVNVLEAIRDAAKAEGLDTDEYSLYSLCRVVDAALEAMGMEYLADADDFQNAVMNAATPQEEEAEEEEEEAEEKEEEENPGNALLEYCEKLVIVRDGKRWLPESVATELLDNFKLVVSEFTEGLPEEIKQKILYEAWAEFGRQLDVAGVLMGK